LTNKYSKLISCFSQRYIMSKYSYIPLIATILILTGFAMFVYNTHKTKNASNLSYTWFSFLIVGQSLLLIHGVINNVAEVYIPAILILLGLFYMLSIKRAYIEEELIEYDLKEKNILN
jgi:uncharacterized protein with PQ loop repeat